MLTETETEIKDVTINLTDSSENESIKFRGVCQATAAPAVSFDKFIEHDYNPEYAPSALNINYSETSDNSSNIPDCYIQEAAYYLWLNAGQPEGMNEYFWHQAIEQLTNNE